MRNHGWKKYGGLLLALLILWGGTPAALGDERTTVTLHDRLVYDTGITTISWDVSGPEESAYQVFYQVADHENMDQFGYIGSASGHSIQTDQLIPGRRYDVIIFDEALDTLLTAESYQMDEPVLFEDGKLKHTSVKVTIEERSFNVASEKAQRVKELSAAAIMAGLEADDVWYGVKYQMQMPMLARTRNYFVTLVFESPDGYVYVDRAQQVSFDRVEDGYQTLWWRIAGVDFFSRLYRDTGNVPTGRYTITLFWDGMWVNDTAFYVKP